jgi:histidyl-tRNA synthetase
VPAVGFSIGVSRLSHRASDAQGDQAETTPLVVVTVFDKKDPAPSFALVRELRGAGVRAEASCRHGQDG